MMSSSKWFAPSFTTFWRPGHTDSNKWQSQGGNDQTTGRFHHTDGMHPICLPRGLPCLTPAFTSSSSISSFITGYLRYGHTGKSRSQRYSRTNLSYQSCISRNRCQIGVLMITNPFKRYILALTTHDTSNQQLVASSPSRAPLFSISENFDSFKNNFSAVGNGGCCPCMAGTSC